MCFPTQHTHNPPCCQWVYQGSSHQATSPHPNTSPSSGPWPADWYHLFNPQRSSKWSTDPAHLALCFKSINEDREMAQWESTWLVYVRRWVLSLAWTTDKTQINPFLNSPVPCLSSLAFWSLTGLQWHNCLLLAHPNPHHSSLWYTHFL